MKETKTAKIKEPSSQPTMEQLLKRKQELADQLKALDEKIVEHGKSLEREFEEATKEFYKEHRNVDFKKRCFFSPDEIFLSEKYGVPLFAVEGSTRHHYIPIKFHELLKVLRTQGRNTYDFCQKFDLDEYCLSRDVGWSASNADC